MAVFQAGFRHYHVKKNGLAGVSVRRVEDITEALWGAKVSPSTISELNQKIYGKIEEWRMQPIIGEHPCIFVDGVYLKRS